MTIDDQQSDIWSASGLPRALLLLLFCDTLCNLPGHSAVAAQPEGTPAHRHTTFLTNTELPDQVA